MKYFLILCVIYNTIITQGVIDDSHDAAISFFNLRYDITLQFLIYYFM